MINLCCVQASALPLQLALRIRKVYLRYPDLPLAFGCLFAFPSLLWVEVSFTGTVLSHLLVFASLHFFAA